MKDYYKNPNLYFIAVPLAATVFVIFVAAISLPAAGRKCKAKLKDYAKAEDLITKIVDLAPERSNNEVKQGSSSEFDYSLAVDEITKLVHISPLNLSLHGSKTTGSGGKRRRGADVTVEPVDVETLSRFISQILLRWPDLECSRLSITKLPAGKDSWKATMKFVYTYQ